jgi:membrane protease YdiL (CAAX protease family)
MLTSTYPLPRAEPQPQSVADATRPRAWGFWATLGWFGVAVVTFIVANVLCGLGYVIWLVSANPGAAISFDAPVLIYLTIAVSMPAAALVLAFAARAAGPSTSGYLGLVWPHRRHILVGLGAMAAFWCAAFVAFKLFPAYDQSSELISEYRALLGNPTALVLFWLTLVVTAPVAEEIIFRGFLMRGWGESRLGMAATVPLTAAMFAVMHIQYNLPTMLMVFGLGVLFGVMRWRSGSTTLTIMLHATWNLAAGVYIALMV